MPGSVDGPFWMLLSRARVGILVLDPQGFCVHANDPACEVIGLGREDCQGFGWMTRLEGDDAARVGDTLVRAAADGRDWSSRLEIRQGAGAVLAVDASGAVVVGGDRLPLGWIVALGAVDADGHRPPSGDERLALLARMLHAAEHERMLMATELHDGPIQHLASFGYTLDRASRRLRAGDVEKGIELLEDVRGDLTREVDTLRRLMAELRPPLLDERGLEASLREYAAEFEERAGIRCTFVGGLGALRFSDDAEIVLYRVTQEALSNVHRHSGASQVTVELGRQDEVLWLIVADDGVGFDTSRASEPGPGEHYGLLALRERVEGVGGEVGIISAPQRGTCLQITVPVLAARAQGDGSAQAESRPAPPTVVVVDDQAAVRNAVVALLSEDGFRVVGEGENGEQAVRIVQELAPDLLLMDLRMPVMGGVEAAAAISASGARTRIVLLSGSDDAETVASCRRAGVCEIVAKSGNAREVSDALHRVLGQAQEEGEGA